MLSCNSHESLKSQLNKSISSIGNNLLYRLRFDINRPVDIGVYKRLQFYKSILNEVDGCSYCFDTKLIGQIQEKINTLTVNNVE